MLRYAPRFHKKFTKKHLRKKILKNFREIFFFGYRGFTANLGYACKNLGGLGPLVWEEIDPAQTVVNPKFIYKS
jgi:hypothetical protein